MDIPEFQQYQLAFAAHLRNPKRNKKPSRVNAQRMQVYTEIAFNNWESTISACYPVSKKVLGTRAWEKLVRGFFSDYKSTTPIFREIPQQFLAYLHTVEAKPAYLDSLAHYEWVELAISTLNHDVKLDEIETEASLLDAQIVFSPAMFVLRYPYPVQMISPTFKPTKPLAEPVNLMVYRNLNDDVKFIELNAIMAKMIEDLIAEDLTVNAWLSRFVLDAPQFDLATIREFAQQVLEELRLHEAIWGTKKSAPPKQ